MVLYRREELSATCGGRCSDGMSIRMTKGSFEYMKRRKRRQGMLSLLMFGIAFGIFALGLLLNNFETSNLFSILAVLMVLPSTKMLISFLILIPYRSVSKKQYDEVIASVSDGVTVLTDVVFTSSEKVMKLDFMIMDVHFLICYTPYNHKRKDMEQYLSDGVRKRGYNYQVEVFDDFEQFQHRITKLQLKDSQKDKNYKETLEYIQSLMV